MPREVQFHPVSDAPIHIDFMRLKKGSTINVMIPVNFTNEEECEGIKLGGVFSITREEVELLCPADDIPSEVECDLTKFEIGDTIRISDVALPEGVEPVINDRDFVVANISAPKTASAEVEDEADDAEEAVEAEEASEE
ncbi:MAG: 50S ribosomal protein L25 [Pseudomonadota bacterium]